MAGLLTNLAKSAGGAPAPAQASRVAELAAEAKRLAVEKEHFVSHLSSNLDSLSGGFRPREQGVSFARLPYERMSSPTFAEPDGRKGVVFARVAGDGLDYSLPDHRAAVDQVVEGTIAEGGTADDAYAAMRNAGVQWVNNWNGIGESPELYAIDPRAIEIRKQLELGRKYTFPRPDSELGIVVDGNWRPAATLGAGMPEVRGGIR